MQPMLKHVKKLLTHKTFNLRKIRKYLTEKAAVSVYKQTILPIWTMLVSCCYRVVLVIDLIYRKYTMIFYVYATNTPKSNGELVYLVVAGLPRAQL